MYCQKCHKQSPDNFVNCAYCGAKLNTGKKKEPNIFVKKEKKKFSVSFKTMLMGSLIFAIVLSVAAIFTATVTGSKPERVVENFVSSIQNCDEKLYYSLFDNDIKLYKKENRYYGDDETFKNMVAPVTESDAFYKEKCGEGYKLSYSISSATVLSDEELEVFCESLSDNFSYISLPTRVDLLCVEVIAEGEKGEYKSVYNDFWCMKIKGKWYKADKNVYTEYEKTKIEP